VGNASRPRLALSLTAAALAAVVLAACSPPGAQGGEDARRNLDDGVVKVGVVGAFSGELSYVGHGVEGGVRYGVDEWNDGGGIRGTDVEMVSCDGRFEPATERTCLTKLVDDDHVDVVVMDSPALAALDPRFVAGLHVPVMLPVLAPPAFDSTTLPNVFVFAPRSDSPEVLARYLATRFPGAPVGIMASQETFTEMALADTKVALERNGLRLVATERFSSGDADFTPQVRSLQSAGAEVMIPLALGADAARMVEAADRIGYRPQVAGTETLYMAAYRELAGELSNDTVLTLPHGSDAVGVSVAFLQWMFEYFRRYGVRVLQVNGSFSPDYPGLELLSYEMTTAALDAIRRAGTSDPAAVVHELTRAEGFTGVGRKLVWDAASHVAKADPEYETWMARFHNGHVMFDADPRAVPALEEARYAVEEWFLADGKVPELNMQTVVALAQRWVEELASREAAAVSQMGRQRYDDLMARSRQGLELAKTLVQGEQSSSDSN